VRPDLSTTAIEGQVERGLGTVNAAQRRAVFLSHALGQADVNTLPALKMFLYAEGLIASPTARLEAVMVDSVERFFELVGADGIALARSN